MDFAAKKKIKVLNLVSNHTKLTNDKLLSVRPYKGGQLIRTALGSRLLPGHLTSIPAQPMQMLKNPDVLRNFNDARNHAVLASAIIPNVLLKDFVKLYCKSWFFASTGINVLNDSRHQAIYVIRMFLILFITNKSPFIGSILKTFQMIASISRILQHGVRENNTYINTLNEIAQIPIYLFSVIAYACTTLTDISMLNYRWIEDLQKIENIQAAWKDFQKIENIQATWKDLKKQLGDFQKRANTFCEAQNMSFETIKLLFQDVNSLLVQNINGGEISHQLRGREWRRRDRERERTTNMYAYYDLDAEYKLLTQKQP